MLTDEQLAKLTEPILAIFRDIEMELLIDVAKRFDASETIGGSLEWRLKKLEDLGVLNREAINVFAKYSKKSRKAIKKMLEEAALGNFDESTVKKANLNVDFDKIMQNQVFKRTISEAYVEMGETFKLIETNALESVKQHYMDIINQSYIEVSSGVYSYGESIEKAVKKMANKGITAATYKRKDGSFMRMGIESVVRRDTLTAVNRTANNSAFNLADEMGCEHVEISSHLGARVSDKSKIANHAGWQGKVYKIHGSDDKYKNLIEETGYGDIEGLSGVNCRHRMFPFFVGISQPAQIQYDSEENKRAYELSQTQRRLERAVRQSKKEVTCLKSIGSEDELRKAKQRQKKAVDKLLLFLDSNNLKRDGLREQI